MLTPHQLEILRRCSRDEQAFLELRQLFETLQAEAGSPAPAAFTLHSDVLDLQADFICRLDSDYRLIYVNPAYARLYNLPAAALIGKSLWSVLKPETMPLIREQLQEVMISGETRVAEHPIYFPDNSSLWVEWTDIPLIDAAGNVIGIQAIGRDITARKLAEKALKESETLLRQIAEYSEEAFYLYDPLHHRIVYINPAYETIWGRSVSELYSDAHVFFQAIHPDDVAGVTHAINFDQINISPYHHEYRIIRPDGVIRHIRARNYPVKDDKGHTIQIVGIAEDVTEKVAAEKHLRELQREREQMRILSHFIHNVSHEFRTPLTIIYTSVHLLMRTTDRKKHEVYQERIVNQINLLTRLVDDLHTMARLDIGRLMDHAVIHVSLLLRQLVAAYQARLPERSFYLNLPDNLLPDIMGSETDLVAALDRLMDNALRFSDETTPIIITACYQATDLIIKIQDAGKGIAPKDMPHIFKRFYRSDTSHTTHGFGLGLPIAKRIIELHQGTIDIVSEPDKGSTVTITLPINT